MFDVRLSHGKIEYSTFFLKSHPNGYKPKLFGFVTIRADIHTCFLPLTNVYKTSLSIFNFTVKLKTCSMLPISTVLKFDPDANPGANLLRIQLPLFSSKVNGP